MPAAVGSRAVQLCRRHLPARDLRSNERNAVVEYRVFSRKDSNIGKLGLGAEVKQLFECKG